MRNKIGAPSRKQKAGTIPIWSVDDRDDVNRKITERRRAEARDFARGKSHAAVNERNKDQKENGKEEMAGKAAGVGENASAHGRSEFLSPPINWS